VCVVHVLRRTTDALRVAIKMIIDEFKRAKIFVEELFNIYGWSVENERRAQLAEEGTVAEVISDGEGGILALTLELLDEENIGAKQVPAGQHVEFVERPIKTIKMRVSAHRIGLEFKLSSKMIVWLVVYVVNWGNQFASIGMKMSAWSYHNGMRLLYRDVTRAGFGKAVIAYRPVMKLVPGQARGEVGVSMGFNPRYPGSIFFISSITENVKTRARFSLAPETDLVALYGRNIHYVPPGIVKPRTKLRFEDSVTTAPRSSPDLTYSPAAADQPRISTEDNVDPYGVPVDSTWTPAAVPIRGNDSDVAATPQPNRQPTLLTASVPRTGIQPANENSQQLGEGVNLITSFEEAAEAEPDEVPTSIDPVGTGKREKDVMRDVIPVVRVSTRANKGRTRMFDEYVAKHTVSVDVWSVNWGKAMDGTTAEQRGEIEESHWKEVDGLLANEMFNLQRTSIKYAYRVYKAHIAELFTNKTVRCKIYK
jgi:hypothetical protein